MYLHFQLENILRLFKVMKMIFKKSIRIVKGTSKDVCHFFLSNAYINIRIKCVLYKMDMIKIRCK